MLPSTKAIKRIKAKIQKKTSSRYAFKPAKELIEEMNQMLTGWTQYFSKGYRAPSYNAVDHYALYRITKHLKRRSQRGYRCPKDKTWYGHIEELGFVRISKRLRPCVNV